MINKKQQIQIPENGLQKNFNLNAHEPAAFDLTPGTGSLIVIGPHNGWNVPLSLRDEHDRPLGLEEEWFNPQSPLKRHETCDWGMETLFTNISPELSKIDCTIITANYSRLVCDFNRAPDQWLTTHMDELEIPIEKNIRASENEIEWRINSFYNPWFLELENQINLSVARSGKAIVLDLHSFTPTWKKQDRKINIGSLRLEETQLSKIIRSGLQTHLKSTGIKFKDDAPYNLKDSPTLKEKFAAKAIVEKLNADYYGLEFRNDLLQDEGSKLVIAKALTNTIQESIQKLDY